MEMFITAALVFSVLVLGSQKSSTARFAPVSTPKIIALPIISRHLQNHSRIVQVGIGLTYFVCHL
jgi:glycerol uptake facilitator-like aquaporin